MKITYEIENGKKVKVKTYVDGSVYKYDENGNKIHYKENNGYEEWYEYNSNGNEIHFKDNGGFEYWKEYDSNGWLTLRTVMVLNIGMMPKETRFTHEALMEQSWF